MLARQGMDFCVHPDARRLGIRTKLRELSQRNPRRNFQMLFSLESGHPAMKRLEERLRRPGRGQLANRIEAWVRRGGRSPVRPDDGGDWVVRQVDQFDERTDSLWDVASQAFQLSIVRRQAYLNWRYADRRAGTFIIKLAERGEDLLGYVVVRMSHGRGYVADVFALPERLDVVQSLVDAGVRDLDAAGASEIECWLPAHHPYWPAFRSAGFTHKRRTIPVSVRSSREYAAVFEMPFGGDPEAAIHITMGDSDLV